MVNLGDQPATRSGNDLLDGLYVDLAAGDWHLWRVDPAGDEPPVAQPGTNGDMG